MLSVAASDVSAMFATLFGKAVDVTDSPGAAALDAVALSVFVTAEQETIAVFAMDTAAAAATASALTDEPVDGAEAAIAAAKLDGDLWENFAEIGNVMSGLLRGDRFPRVLLHSVSQVGRAEWDALVSAALESSTFTLTVEGYPAGNLTIFDVIDAPPGSIPAFLQEINPTNAAAEVDVDRWRPYSFSKPRTVSHEELRTLQSRAEDLVAALTTACNGLVSPPIRQKLLQTQSKVWEDYAANVVSPSLMISFQLRPLEGRFILTWPLELVMAFVDLMLGGSGQPLAAPRQPSRIDLALAGAIHGRALERVPDFFADLTEVRVEDVRVDLDTGPVAGVPPKSNFLVLWLSTAVGGVEYQTTLGMPMLAVRPLIDLLLADPEESNGENPLVRERLLDVMLEVTAEFPPVSVPATQLAELTVGDVIILDAEPREPTPLICGDIQVASAVPVSTGRRVAVQIREAMLADGVIGLP